MPNGHDYSKLYGPHKYADNQRTSNCLNQCGCWMGPARSGGPTGVDPFDECPRNPLNGKLLGGNADVEVVVTRRIRKLESRASRAEKRAKVLEEINKTDKIQLYDDLVEAKKEIERLKNLLKEISEKASL